MKNIKMEVKGNILKVEIDLSKNYGESNTGKTDIIASSSGNQELPTSKDLGFRLSCTLFKYRDSEEHLKKKKKKAILRRERRIHETD